MKRILFPALAAVLFTFLPHPAGAQTNGGSTVTVLHGIPGLTVDVYANGDVLVPGFEPGDQFGPAELPAGDYQIAIRAAGSPPDSEPAISRTITVPADVNATAIAHLDAGGDPTLSVFVNDVSALDPGNARVTVRHTAAFGAVDVLAAESPLIQGLTNPEEASQEVPGGTYAIAVTAAGSPDTRAFAGDVTFDAGTAYFVHAIGDPTADSFDLLIQTVDGLGDAQVLGVSTGSGGLLADDESAPVALLIAIAAAASVLIALPVLRYARHR